MSDTQKLEGLDVIRNSGILADHSVTLERFAAELVETYQRAQVHRTRTEMDVAVLDDFHHPTPDAKYWQAVREQDVQYTQLVLAGFEYQSLSIKTEKLRRKLETATDLDAELLTVKIARNEYILRLQEREGFHRLREIAEWSDIKSRLIPECKYSLVDVNAHQMDSLGKYFEHQADSMTDSAGPSERMNILGLQATSRRIRGE
jgi:hypothetical protein